ncbi:hemagglutinin repeat-containing protein [Mycetohabitans rhizoxinica]|uniref:hemagglutinin repeat-containing protein n=1 Tax=Mycetohabitans rhizoxinica TaxID=412963 RepID=UPI0030CD26B5
MRWILVGVEPVWRVGRARFVALGLSAWPAWGLAQIVPAPGGETRVIQTQNGLPQVDIARPSGAGVSVNHYHQFDVQAPGAILNNASAVVKTDQAGYINGNPHFDPNQSARLIVNEVHSLEASQLRGHVEVAGPRAEVVVANPSGIVVNGGGFINTSRATLTTGQPYYGADGSLAGFNVSRGLVTVHGAEFKASDIDQVDLIARAVQANAKIYAKNLNVVTGANQVPYDTLAATPIHGDGPAPSISIDVGQLGGMYADRIVMVGTEYGVGVHSAGEISAQAGDLTLTSEGRLVLTGKTQASGNIGLSAAGGIDNRGTIDSRQYLSVNTCADLVHSGMLTAQKDVTVNAGSVHSTGTLGAGVNGDGSMGQSGDLQVTATGLLSVTGKHGAGSSVSLMGSDMPLMGSDVSLAGSNVFLTGSNVNLAGSLTIANGGLTLNANAGDLNLSAATTSAQGGIKASASGALINDHGKLSSGADVTLMGGSVSNQSGKISAQGPLLVKTGGQVANQSGELLSQSTVEVHGGAILNQQGIIESASHMTVDGASLDNFGGRVTSLNRDSLSVTTSGQLTNTAGTAANGAQGGVISGNGDVTVQGGIVANQGTMSSKANLRVIGQQFVGNGNGLLKAAQNVTVDAGSRLYNAGGTIVGQAATLNATTLDNRSGTVEADRLSLNGTDLLNRGGSITQTGFDPIAINISGTLDNSNDGTLKTNSTDLKLAPAALINDGGTLYHAGNGTLTLGNGAGSISNVSGKIDSNGQIVVQTNTFNNTSGSLIGQTELNATLGGTLTNDNGTLKTSAGAAILHSTTLSNRGGSIGAPHLSLTVDSTLDNDEGTLEANQLTLKAADLTNRGGKITQWQASPMTVEVSGKINNSNGGTLKTNSHELTLAPAELINSGGTITHAGTGTLTVAPGHSAGPLDNTSGRIESTGQVLIEAGDLNNVQGVVSAQHGIIATIKGDVNNTQGLLHSDMSLSLTNEGALVNQAGHIQAGQLTPGDTSTLEIQSASIDNTDGLINDLGTGNMTVRGTNQIVNSHAGGVADMGKITGNGDVTVSAASIVNTQGGQLSGATLHVQGATLDNRGGKIGNLANSNGDVDVTMTGAVTNTDGSISSTRNLTVAAATLQGGGTYGAANDATLHLQGDYTVASDTQFNVGYGLTFTLPGTFTNHANLQLLHNLSVNAGNIVNSGSISAGSLLRTHSGHLTNTGTLVGGSATIQAHGTVSNLGPTALMGASDSQGLLEILARDIENRDDTTAIDTMAQTGIVGMGKVVLAGGKDANGHYTRAALINNQSARIESGGPMQLHADRVLNTRRVMRTSGFTENVDPALLARHNISMQGCTAIYMEACYGHSVPWVDKPTPEMANMIGGAFIEPPHGGQWNSTYQYTTYEGKAVANTVTDISPAGQIISGGALDASAVGLLQNYWSNVAVVGDIQQPTHLDMDGWAATGQQAPMVRVRYSGQYHYNNYDNSEHNWQLPFGDAPFVTGRPGGYTQAAPADIKDYRLPGYDATWGANGTISGTGVSIKNPGGNASTPSLGLPPGQPVSGPEIGSLNGSVSGTKLPGMPVRGNVSTIVDPIIASATALNVLNNLTIPQGGLFRPNLAPNPSYVIETNPAFTNHKHFISSDYFFKQIGVDLTPLVKRLGDGFYEQQLVRNQVTALTGKAVLGPHTDVQSMYQSLMAAGAELSKSLDLPIGVSLSAEQVSKLTGNVVMMETRVVDGQSVLVPVVYLAKTSQQNMDGPLITATNIDLQNVQSFTNSGTVKAEHTLAIQGKQIDNAFGTLQSGGLMSLTTEGKIDLTSANVKAGSLQLEAGKDLVLDTATKTTHQVSRDGATRVTTRLGPTTKLEVTGDASIVTGGDVQQHAGNLVVGGDLSTDIGGHWTLGAQQIGEHKIVQRANGVSNTDINSVVGSSVKVGGMSNINVGGDLTAKGAQIDLGQGGNLVAKGDVSLGSASATMTTNSNSSGSDSHGSYAEMRHTLSQTLTGTALKGGNTVNIVSGQDITVSGSAISLDKGRANLLAAGDVNVGAATETHVLNSHETHSHSNVVSGSQAASGIDQTAAYSQGSTISADGVTVASGRDVNIMGSNVVGSHDVKLQAGRDVNITTSQDGAQSSSYYDKKESGLLSGGELAVTIGSRRQSDQAQSSSLTHHGSVVGSVKGNVTIDVGSELLVKGSDLIAAKDVVGTAKTVKLQSATDEQHHSGQHAMRQSGVTLGVQTPGIAAVSNVVQQASAGAHSQDDRVRALRGIAGASGLYDAYQSVPGELGTLAKGELPEAKLTVSIGSSGSRSAFSEDSTQARGNRVQAGGLAKFQATGEKDQGQGNVIIHGSDIDAKNVHLEATHRVDLLNSTDTERMRNDNGSTSGSVGVSIGTKGLGVSASAARAKGDGNSDWAMQNNTHVRASDTVTLKSGGDTNVVGANVKGNRVVADVQGDLNVASVQDTSVSAAHQHSAGVGLNVSQGGGSASFNVQNGNARGNYASVAEQAGIEAGEGGFDIAVKGNTDLKGAYISSEAAKDQNRLKTGMLSYSAIENHSDYQASTFGISGGATTGDGGNVYKPTGSTSGKNAGGASPLYLSESGSSRARTQSAISDAEIEITNPDQQKQDIAGLNRHTTNLNGQVDKTPDVQQSLQNQGELMSAMRDAGEAVARRIGDVADAKREALLQAASESDDPQQKQQYLAEAEQWDESGRYRVGLQSAGGSLVGGIGGGLLGAAQSGAGSLMSALLANKLDAVSRQIADQKPTGNADLDKTLGNIVANAMSTVAGGVVGGAQGAQAAYNVDRFNRQLHQDANPRKDERKRIEQDIAPAYAAAHAGMTVEEATDRLAAQLLRQVDTTAASQGGWDQDASNYLNAYAATHPGETIGKDQWDNAVPLFGTAAGYQRNDSTIFSANPQTTNPPPQLGLRAVGGYFAGMGQGLADTVSHPLDTLWGGIKGAYGLITDPQGTAQQMQGATRHVVTQAGEGNFGSAGQQVGRQVGSTVMGTAVGAGAGKAAAVLKGKNTLASNYMYNAMTPGPLPDGVAGTFAGGRYSVGTVQASDTVFFRAGDANNPGGSFFSFKMPQSVAQARIDNAVKPYWTDPSTGAITGVSPINSAISARFPVGTKYYYGPVGIQGGVYLGGQDSIQIFIPNARTIGTFTPIKPLK